MYTPADLLILWKSLAALNAPNTALFVARAAGAATREEAMFQRRRAELLAANAKLLGIGRFVDVAGFPLNRMKDGRLVALFPLDEVAWTEDVSAAFSKMAAATSSEASPESAAAIFKEVGKLLLHQRELLGLSIEDIERHTHLRQHYLQALEAGYLEGLPSPVQARGMLNNYAAFLGMDPEALLLRFADGLQARLQAKRAIQSEGEPRFATARPKRSSPAPVRRVFSTDMLIGGSVALFLIVFVVWGAIRIFTTVSTSASTATAPSIAEVLLATSTPSETPTFLPPSATAPPPQLLFPTFPVVTGTVTGTVSGPQQIGVQVYLTIRQRAWMRVIVDGNVEFDGRVTPGSAYPFVGGSQVEVLTGNGEAIQVFFNGQDYGVMGEFGQLVHQIYSLQGILAPTATVTHTPSPTLPLTATPANTSTLAPAAATAPALP
jgi:cytoskeletal protein RodZ